MTEKLPPKILVVEQDEVQRSMLCNTIERYWFTVLRAKDSQTAVKMMSLDKPHIVVISSKIQDITAAALAKKLREVQGCSEMPIILILNEDESEESYAKLDATFIEFVKRPFTPNAVMTSIKNLIRKAKPVFQDKVINYQDLAMDLATFKVARGEKKIHLGPTEFKILQLLVQSPKIIFSRQEIIDYVWGVGKDIEPRTVDVHVNRLRSLIKLNRAEIPFIKTIRNSGYCLNLPGEIC